MIPSSAEAAIAASMLPYVAMSLCALTGPRLRKSKQLSLYAHTPETASHPLSLSVKSVPHRRQKSIHCSCVKPNLTRASLPSITSTSRAVNRKPRISALSNTRTSVSSDATKSANPAETSDEQSDSASAGSVLDVKMTGTPMLRSVSYDRMSAAIRHDKHDSPQCNLYRSAC